MPNTFHSGLKSYLMSRATKNNNHIINNWLSTTCLFDGYLIEALNRYQVVWKTIDSYLTTNLKTTTKTIIKYCKSAICLFDGYLIEVDYKGYKTPKPLDKSGFFPPLPLGQRDMSKVAILNI